MTASAVVAILGLGAVGYRTSQTHRTVLTTGVTGGVRWQLYATNEGDGSLCMGMAGGRQGDYGFTCGFGPTRLSGIDNSSEFPLDLSVVFGPAPSAASTVLVRPAAAPPLCRAPHDQRIVTAKVGDALPSWAPGGRWFAVVVAHDNCADTVQFFDSSGNPVPDHDFGT
ncbi:MAG: hypothetical protein QOK12_892 [Mycobacterium sp.]|nr:hypothetical protein [Mycobacterium sp.]